MRLTFSGKKLSGLLAILPENELYFDDEINNYNFPPSQSLRLKKVMGYEKHRIVKETTAPSDLCVFGLKQLIHSGRLNPNDIDALIVVTQTPDYFVPPTSNVIQGRIKLRKDILCMDINQACAGYLVGLMQAFMLLDYPGIEKVVLINVDILSKKISKQDRNSYPLAGDAAAISIIENNSGPNKIYFNLFMDGEKCEALMIPAGGFKHLSTSETALLRECGDGNMRSLDNLTMDGTAIFNFVQTEVPNMIADLMKYAHEKKENVDLYLFHQPNKFMLEKLADKLGVPRDKVPMNIVSNYGNSSSVTIPLNIAHNLSDRITQNKYKCCLAGFGAGLAWSSMLIELGKFDFCELIYSPY
jgi:3-oxoacyl-[acyl-carrier-protein] synthase-3